MSDCIQIILTSLYGQFTKLDKRDKPVIPFNTTHDIAIPTGELVSLELLEHGIPRTPKSSLWEQPTYLTPDLSRTMTAIGELLQQGERRLTPEMIYKKKKGLAAQATVSPEEKALIMDEVDLLSRIRVFIALPPKNKGNRKATINGYLIYVPPESQSNDDAVYEFPTDTDLCCVGRILYPVLYYHAMNRAMAQLDMDFLFPPNGALRSRLQERLTMQILERIERIRNYTSKRGRKDTRYSYNLHTISIDSLLAVCGVSRSSSRVQRKRAVDLLRLILEAYKQRGYMDYAEKLGKWGRLEQVIVWLYGHEAPKLPAPKKAPKKTRHYTQTAP